MSKSKFINIFSESKYIEVIEQNRLFDALSNVSTFIGSPGTIYDFSGGMF